MCKKSFGGSGLKKSSVIRVSFLCMCSVSTAVTQFRNG